VVNVVDLMKLQPQSEHPHGLSDTDFDELFTRDKPVIFAYNAYPWLIHRLLALKSHTDPLVVFSFLRLVCRRGCILWRGWIQESGKPIRRS